MSDRSRSIAVPATLIAIATAARLVSLHALHPLNWDEIEFFRATDWVRQGLVPYRDFWEHHTPLQWFLFAPVEALVHSPGAAAIIAMRWAQLPLWVATFWLINVLMRDAGVTPFARWAAMAVPLTSTFFMLPAVEYRVDVLGIALLILALVLLQRMDRGVVYALAAGAAFALGGFANLRMGPVIVVLMLLTQITRLHDRKWGGSRRAYWIFAGAAATTALGALYFVVTRSFGDAVRHAWRENYVADRLAENVPTMFVHRIVAPFGLRLVRPGGGPPFTWSGVDIGGMLLVALAIAGAVRVIRTRFRAPDEMFFVAAAIVVNSLFIAAMKTVFNYHLEVVAVVAVPLIASEIERIRRQQVVVAMLIAATLLNVAVALFRGKEDDLAYQDTIMTEADRRTPEDSAVFDGAGWALHRKPAYRYWFLRNLVRQLERHGYFETYRPEQMLTQPPAAIITDHDTRLWLIEHVALGRIAVTHYLPLWRDLWLPGLSARLPAGAAAAWIAPAEGDYRVFASERLATHPWFRQPFGVWPDPAIRSTSPDTSGDVAFAVDDAPAGGNVLHLRKGAHVVAMNRGRAAAGVMLVRGDPSALFRQPPPGVTLEGSESPQWHIPRFDRMPPPR